MAITKSAAKSWLLDDDPSSSSKFYAPEKAYDGDLSTFYSVKDGKVDGNFLKLYLSEKSLIRTVRLTNREDCCQGRIIGTVVTVYSTEGGSETKVADCGTEITGNHRTRR